MIKRVQQFVFETAQSVLYFVVDLRKQTNFLDIFYFKILSPNGSQPEQNGEKLWGRFVRVPSTDYPDQSNIVWMMADWKFDGSKWISETKRGITLKVEN